MKVKGTEKRQILFDCALAVFLLLLALTAFLLLGHRDRGSAVRVYVQDECVGEYSLSRDGVYVLNGGTHLLCVEEGAARLTEASCPDLLCVKQGRVSRTGERIICLPYRLTVEVTGGGEEIIPTGG